MKEEIEDILMNSYDKFGNFDEPKATKELLNLFGVSKPLAPKEVKNCMKEQLKCGSVCKEHCGASWC